MDGLMNGGMDVTKYSEAPWERAEAGAGRLSDHCFFFFFFLVSVFCQTIDKHICLCFFKFLSSCTGEKEGLLSKNPADTKTVRYCFVTCFFYFLIKLLTFNPPPFLQTMSSVKPLQFGYARLLQSCWYDTKSFFFMFFIMLQTL